MDGKSKGKFFLWEILASYFGGYIVVWKEMTHFVLGFWVR